MIRYDRLIDLTKIGRGEFGEVLIGYVLESDVSASIKGSQHAAGENGTDVNEISTPQRVHVMAKSLSKLKDETFFIEFRRQIDLHRAVDSSNVVKLLALCFEKDHHFIVMEHNQDLRGYLLEHTDTSSQTLVNFCRQIACALEKIAKSKLTHR
jgi:serine/threonine protein kinase